MEWYTKTVSEVATLGALDVDAALLAPANKADAHRALREMIAFLIDHNFEKLLWILYRIDVDEMQAKQLLSKHLPEEAPGLLATLILTREQQKQAAKEAFNNKAPDTSDESLLL